MINLKFRLLYVSFFVLLLMGCVAEAGMPDTSKGEEGAAVTLRLDTRALGTGESQINTLRVIQVKRNIAKSIANNQFVSTPGTPLLIPGVSGAYDIYIIANEMDDDSELAALKNAADLEELRQVILPYNVAQRTTTTIPMFGKVEEVAIGLPTTASGNATIKVAGVDKGTTIAATVTRLAVRIDLTVKSKSFSGLASVSFTGLPDGISLFGNNYKPASGSKQTLTVQGSEFTTVTPVTAGYITEKKRESIILPSYLFDPKTEVSKAARIEVFIQGKPASFGAAIGHVARPAALDKDYTLHPNAQYTLAALVAGDDLTIESQVKNWEMAPSDYPAGGGSFWNGQPTSARVGIDGTDLERTAVFTAKISSNASVSYKWYRKRQHIDMSYTTELLVDGVGGVAISQGLDHTSTLTVVTSKLDDSGVIYCKGITTSPDGRQESLESAHATLMVVGTQISLAGEYPDMQNWVTPRNALLGATCLLRDSRDGKVYRMKLMADGHWWMIQDLAYGEEGLKDAFSESAIEDYNANYSTSPVTKVGSNIYYGAAMPSGNCTGGYLYNTHAAIQFTEIHPDDRGLDYKAISVKYTLLPSLCPEGWHLPGNLNEELNYEWTNFCDKIVGLSLGKYEYNSARNFNAYIEDIYNIYNFHGGYYPSKDAKPKPVSYNNLSIGEEYSINDIYVGIAAPDRNDTGLAYPIRCVRDYVK